MQYLTIKKANLLYLLCMLLVLSLGFWFQTTNFSIGLLLTEVCCIFLPGWYFLRLQKLDVMESIQLHKSRSALLLIGLILGMGTWMTASLIDGLTVQLTGYQVPPPAGMIPETWLQAVLIFIGLALAAPLCEEFVFRGILQNSYHQSYHAGTAIWVSAFLFSIFHLRLQGFPGLLIISLVLAYAYWRTRSLFVTVTIHFANNFWAAIVLIQAGIFPHVEMPFRQGTTLILGFFLLVVGLLLLVRTCPSPAVQPSLPKKIKMDWRKFWPIGVSLLIFVAFAALEVINREPINTLTLASPQFSSPLNMHYQLLDKAGQSVGNSSCELTQQANIQSIVCERSNQPFELQTDNSYYSSSAGITIFQATWQSEDLNLLTLETASQFADYKINWQIKPKDEQLFIQTSGDQDLKHIFTLSPDGLVAEEWPFRLMGLPFAENGTWITSYLEPMTWREKSQDNGPLLKSNIIVRCSTEKVDVPAGTFFTWKVQLSNGLAAWYDQSPPHLPIKIAADMFDFVLIPNQ